MKRSDINIGEMIRERMDELDYSYNTLARFTGISKSALQRYVASDGSKIPLDKMQMIADVLRLDPVWLLGWDDDTPAVTDDVIRMPILNEVAAGYTGRADEDWEAEQIEIPRSYLRGRPASDFFLLRVKGDSMYPLYIAGDIVLVLKQKTLNRSGDIGVIRYDGENATLKKVEYVMGEDWMKLIPINPQYPPMMIENEDLELCEVLGVPRMVIREVT